jgi:hypothetical protein
VSGQNRSEMAPRTILAVMKSPSAPPRCGIMRCRTRY